MAEPDSSIDKSTPIAPGFPFAARLMLSLSASVLLAGGGLLLIMRHSAISDARAMADQLFREVARHAADTSRADLQRVVPLINSLAAIAGDGGLPLEQDDALVNQLLPFIRNTDGVAWISYADASGRFVGVQRLGDGKYGSNISHIDPAGHTHLVEASISPGGARHVTRDDPDSGYDPRTRPFYAAAAGAGDNPVWLEPYVFYGQNVLGITCARAVRRGGQVVGVMTIDFTLDTLQQALLKLRVSDRSILCVYTEAGKVIATQDAQSRLSTTLPSLSAASPRLAALLQQTDQANGPLDLDLQGDATFAATVPFEVAPGQRWIVGVVAPAGDFLAGAYQSQRNALLACMAALLAALGLAAALARRVSRPVRQLTHVMRKIGGGDLDAKAHVGGAREFVELSQSLNHMVDDLRNGIRLRHSIGVAMQVQQNLLPEAPPIVQGLDIAGCSRYCDETGGDYYDFLATDAEHPGRLTVVVGDVTGHGIGSALLMATARAVLRDRAAETPSLADLLKRLNRTLLDDSEVSQFMTMLVIHLDTQADTYRFASAGHDAAIIYRAATDSFQEIDEAGLPLGVADDGFYEDYAAPPLAAGDLLLAGTDGVWEMHGPGDELFGKDRLKDVIRANAGRSAKEIAAAIDASLEAFRRGRPVADDVTYVLVKRV